MSPNSDLSHMGRCVILLALFTVNWMLVSSSCNTISKKFSYFSPEHDADSVASFSRSIRRCSLHSDFRNCLPSHASFSTPLNTGRDLCQPLKLQKVYVPNNGSMGPIIGSQMEKYEVVRHISPR